MTKQIPLTRGLIATVDDEDFQRVAQHKWYAARTRKIDYAVRAISIGYKKQRKEYLHRFIMDAPPELTVDHIDGNGLNCTRANMRLATPSENSRNRGRDTGNASGYKGVTWREKVKKWRAIIYYDGRNHELGTFETVEEAAAAYDAAALRYHGEFAHTNLKHQSSPP